MNMTVEVVGGETNEAAVGDDGTYMDLVRAVDLSPHEMTVLVDGRPVPEDQSVEVDRVKVLRLIKGGQSAVWKAPGETARPAEPVSTGATPTNWWP